ncbi:MAG: type II toxin-antitoxin system Phd/YefM family antitoxin [Desulfohalobiaceae bacterium]
MALMDKVARTGETLVVTKNGKPIAELKPYSGRRSESPFGLHRKLQITGDVIAPVAENDWKVLE